jgi:phosphatidylserine/phosphatidylglycerophosphate/cardiolipin synthase-like enzyme
VSFTIAQSVLCDLLPDDGQEAEGRFLNLLTNPQETWIIAYAFTLPAMIRDVETAFKAGVPLHIYLDHSQEQGSTERPLVEAMAKLGVEVTVGTSTAGQRFICHDKALVTRDAHCFVGSCNFSSSGWEQVNAIFEFDSKLYAQNLVWQFNKLVEYAWSNERSFQLMSAQPAASTIE